VPIGPELALELKGLMAASGFYRGEVDGRWEPAAQQRFELFLGSENYDNRIDRTGLLDLEVLADLRLRYGHLGDDGPAGDHSRARPHAATDGP